MLNMRPPKPRYTHTWDVHLVTKYLDCLGKTKLLPLKLLSIKLVMLFALPCPERAWSLAKLELRPRKEFPSHLCLRESEALQINYVERFLRPSLTMRDSVLWGLCAIISKLHETYVQFSHRQNQILCSFLMSNRIIQSLRPLLAVGYAQS